MDYQPYLEFTRNLAFRAGKISLEYYQKGITAEYKGDKSPVTAADRAVETFIRKEIESTHPGHEILGEEYGVGDATGKSIRWIIDPIDGTKSFLRGIPLYAVLIGMEVDGVVRVGAAYYPALDEMLCAADGKGCWWNSRQVRVSPIGRLDEAYVCYTSMRDLEKDSHARIWTGLKQKAYALRGWSDAYGYLAVATGRAEVMLDPVMKVWDSGPFPPIFHEAGGYFGSWDGREGHLHGEALACNKELLSQILELQ